METAIFGSKGQLGRDLALVFSGSGEVYGGDLPEVDIADEKRVAAFLDNREPAVVINAAAFTDVEGAEDREEEAFRANAVGARVIARAAYAKGVPVVYFSTDYVFGSGKTTPYVPEDVPAPIGVYARSKLAGETATRDENPQHLIVRTAWLYGPGGTNFVEKVLRAARTRRTLKGVTDEVGSPTHTWDLAQATLALFRAGARGTFHAVNAGACSRYEWAKTILELAGLDVPVVPCASSEFPTKATRPLYSVLSSEKLERATDYTMRNWKEALRHYMERRPDHS